MSEGVERWEELDARIGEIVNEFADILAPKNCRICGDESACEHGPEMAEAIEQVMPTDYLLVHRWAKMDGSGGYWDWTTHRSLLMVESIGVLTVVLDDARDRLRR